MITSIQKYKKILESNQYNTILIIDVQPEYLKAITFDLHNLVQYIRQNIDKKIIFMWNGPEINGCDENEYKYWLIEELNFTEDEIDQFEFYDKEYGYIRELIDSGCDEIDITNVVKFMIDKDITDASEINLEEYKSIHGEDSAFDFLDANRGSIGLSDNLLNYLSYQNNILLLGGNKYECLKEIEIFLDALEKKYQIVNQFVY